MTSYHTILTILLALLGLLLLRRCSERAIDPNYGILTAAVGLPLLKSDRRRRDVLLFDLDNFKAFNTAYGHSEADRRVRLALLLRRGDACTLVKRGGDEVLVSCPAGRGDQIAMLLRERLACQGLTATIAIAHDVTDAAPILTRAERAILSAKQQGNKNTIIVLSS